MELKVEYLNTENIKNPISTYKVTGKHNDVPVNEVVSLDIMELQDHLGENLDVLKFLQIIEFTRKDIESSKIYSLITQKAYEKSYELFSDLKKYKLMMMLSNGEKKKYKGKLITYDRNGKINTY